MSWLLRTDASATRLFQRLVLAAVIFPHGAQKLLGWFGGHGFSATMQSLSGPGGLPWIVALLVVVAESVGSVALALGLLSRLSALGIAAVMLGAMVRVHVPNGFFMNWGGAQAGEGFEYHLLALALALPIVVLGGGRLSLDRYLLRKQIRERRRRLPTGLAAPVRG